MNAMHASPWRSCVAVAAVALSGCTSMSGLSGSSDYACKAPAGVTCDSVSGTYANAIQNNLPSQRPRSAAPVAANGSAAPPAPGTPAWPSGPASAGTTSGSLAPLPIPLRSSARILRLWFKPWEDADRDLYDQGYVYVQIDSGQWLIEHAQRQIREAYAPLRPPPRGTAPANEPNEGATALPPLKGTPRLPSVETLLPGLVPPAGRPDGRPEVRPGGTE
jgi:conjugal transfer pilus assembly protein TraV